MGFSKFTEVSASADVRITNTDIIAKLKEEDAKKVVLGLLDKFPSLLQEKKVLDKLEPKTIRDLLTKAGAKVNTSLTDFQQTKPT